MEETPKAYKHWTAGRCPVCHNHNVVKNLQQHSLKVLAANPCDTAHHQLFDLITAFPGSDEEVLKLVEEVYPCQNKPKLPQKSSQSSSDRPLTLSSPPSEPTFSSLEDALEALSPSPSDSP